MNLLVSLSTENTQKQSRQEKHHILRHGIRLRHVAVAMAGSKSALMWSLYVNMPTMAARPSVCMMADHFFRAFAKELMARSVRLAYL
ncbi:MAG: hypothetical protein WBX25_08595 [Rhodomicrobium sp.]